MHHSVLNKNIHVEFILKIWTKQEQELFLLYSNNIRRVKIKRDIFLRKVYCVLHMFERLYLFTLIADIILDIF